MSLAIWIVVGLLVLFGAKMIISNRRFAAVKDEIQQAVDGGARLVDVRTPGEFGGGHLPGAVNVPLDQLEGSLKKVGSKDRPVVVYCASGARSHAAQGVLHRKGYEKVYDLGGIANGRRLTWPAAR